MVNVQKVKEIQTTQKFNDIEKRTGDMNRHLSKKTCKLSTCMWNNIVQDINYWRNAKWNREEASCIIIETIVSKETSKVNADEGVGKKGTLIPLYWQEYKWKSMLLWWKFYRHFSKKLKTGLTSNKPKEYHQSASETSSLPTYCCFHGIRTNGHW